ncbi:hypothetical protein BIW11_11224 [Tropilaelaps mercedesae]|uniref:Uncharacterized protein n=1 Tax=Tropilaelaps mercedesae TaxID=418985 RepID=A0A1V9XC18_9ACAR|nr:hypothetical protein BIW11_11224 [Tropilaelaps mercedesae]
MEPVLSTNAHSCYHSSSRLCRELRRRCRLYRGVQCQREARSRYPRKKIRTFRPQQPLQRFRVSLQVS